MRVDDGGASAGPGDEAGREASPERVRELLTFASPTGEDPSRVLVQLRERARSAPAERPLIEMAIAVVGELEQAKADPASAEGKKHLLAGVTGYLALLREVGARFPDDAKMQRTVAATTATMASVVEALGVEREVPPAGLRKDSLERAQAITRRFPGEAKSWALLGELLDAEPDRLVAMRAYARCLALAPAEPRCTEPLARERAAYVAPYCETADLRPGLGWFDGWDHPNDGAVRSSHPSSQGSVVPLFVATKARFSGREVGRVQGSRIEVGPTTDMDTGREIEPAHSEPVVRLTLRPEAVDAFGAWLEELQASRGEVVLARGAKVLFVAQPHHGHRSASVSWDLSHVALTELCAKTKTLTLPADLEPKPAP